RLRGAGRARPDRDLPVGARHLRESLAPLSPASIPSRPLISPRRALLFSVGSRGVGDKSHRCRGDGVEAFVEGQPRALSGRTSATFIIYAKRDGLRLLSLEVREPGREAQGWRSLFDGKSANCIAAKFFDSW